MEVKITCQSTGSTSTLEDLHIIQDDLKDLSEENYQKLKRSIIGKGFFAPFFVWKKDKVHNLLDGTQRKLTLLKMKEEGTTIPADYPIVLIDAQNYQDAKERILAISSQYGKMTEHGLNHFLEDIDLGIDDMGEMFNFDGIDLSDLSIESDDDVLSEPSPKDDEVPEDVDPMTMKGDIWLLGDHRVMCGDSTKMEDVDRLMDGEKADMVFTDPPYNQNREYTKNTDDNRTDSEYSKWCKKWFGNIEAPRVAITPGLKNLSMWASIKKFNWVLAWVKENAMLGSPFGFANWEPIIFYGKSHKKKGSDIIKQTIHKQEIDHDCPKQIGFMEKAIHLLSEQAELVLDIFLGSGTTLIACQKTNRRCYGMEIDEKYCDVIVQRYIDFTGDSSVSVVRGDQVIDHSDLNNH